MAEQMKVKHCLACAILDDKGLPGVLEKCQGPKECKYYVMFLDAWNQLAKRMRGAV